MSPTTADISNFSSRASSQLCRCFSFSEIESATRNFDDDLVIGHGGFGKVYKGDICDGETTIVVAIKRLDSMSNQGAPEFRAEIKMLSRLRHCHLVSLIGYCDDNEEMIIVYEYMPRGTLHDHLHKTGVSLDWVQRLKIAIGAARGLDYLHTGVGTQHGVIHRDVKSSNILLDENWAAMISDFGLSKIGPTNQPSSYVNATVKGTFGYLDPEYYMTGRLTRKTDVFAFGVVLFEIISGKLAVDMSLGEEQCSLARWAQNCVKERKFDQIVDPNIRGKISPKCLKRFVQIANRCLDSCPKERPTMAEVVVTLQLLQALQAKFDDLARRDGAMGFTWNMQKYFVFSNRSGIDSSKSGEVNMNYCSSTKEDGGIHYKVANTSGEMLDRNLKMFTYTELKRSTRDFGYQTRMGYGNVFKGWIDERTYTPSKLDIGLAIAVKKVHQYNFKSLEKAEMDLKILREFVHPNLVKLIGYCLKKKTLFLVHEFMEKGSLMNYLCSGAAAQFPLHTRVKIAAGLARGLLFLQKKRDEVCEHLSWTKHGDWFGAHCILLDEDFNAKLSELNVSKLEPYFKFVESDDDYYYPGCEPLQIQSDVFGFGVMLAELLTGKPIRVLRDLQEMHRLSRRRDKIISSLKLLFGEKAFIDKEIPEDLVIGSYPKLLYDVARFCFDICNDVDSESKILKVMEVLNEYMQG